jgi:response regulator RpfG family c-di-GMP phosphodiesterase
MTPQVSTVNRPILIVDDNKEVLFLLSQQLTNAGYLVEDYSDPVEASQVVIDKNRSFSCIIVDRNMPTMSGLSLLKLAQEHKPLMARIMISGQADLDMAMSAINEGQIFRFMVKPWQMGMLLSVVAAASTYTYDEQSKHDRKLALVADNQALTQQNQFSQENFEFLSKLYINLLIAYSPILGAITQVTIALCQALNKTGFLNPHEQKLLRFAAIFNNVGLMSSSRSIIRKSFIKPQQLTAKEKALIERHPCHIDTLLPLVGDLHELKEIIRAHHENWDGSGYPDGLGSHMIPRVAQFLAIACYYAESNHYKEELNFNIQQLKGKRFAPEAVEAYMQLVDNKALPPKIQELKINQLRSGLTLACDVKKTDGQLLVNSHKTITPRVLEHMHELRTSNEIDDSVLIFCEGY